MQVRYQAALRPESGYFNPCSCSRTARSSRLIAARSTPAPAAGGALRTGSGLSSWVSELSRRLGAPPLVEPSSLRNSRVAGAGGPFWGLGKRPVAPPLPRLHLGETLSPEARTPRPPPHP